MADNVKTYNLSAIKKAIANEFTTQPRNPKGLLVFGDAKKIIKRIEHLYEIANIDCPAIKSFNYAPLFNRENQQVGIAYIP